jgi:hypothetical protein
MLESFITTTTTGAIMLKKHIFHIAVASCLTLTGLSTFIPSTTMAGIPDNSGTVLETMNGGGYTYIYVDTGVAKNWVAVPETTVSAGDTITYSQGMEMTNFHSKTLDRTFSTILFSSGLGESAVAQATTTASTSAPADDSFAAAVAKEQQQAASTAAPVMMETTAGSSGAVAPFEEMQVEKAEGDNSYTVEEIYSRAKELNGKKVRLQGKVVKYNPNIMGRNWLHIQDGSGNPINNTHDLVVTTSETVSGNEIIVVEGKLTANKDFGAGYKYAAIIEEAVVIK